MPGNDASAHNTLDFGATTSLFKSLSTQPISRAKTDVGTKDAQDKTKYRTIRADTTWVPKSEKEAAITDVSTLTKTAWHIGQGYNIGAGFSEQHGWETLASNAGLDAPRRYEYAGLTVKAFTKSSGPFMKDQFKESRVADMLASKKDRHEREIVDFEAKLKAINESFEPMVVDSIRRLRKCLSDNDEAIEHLFLQLADEFLTRIDMAQLQGVWSGYQDQSQLRENWIAEVRHTILTRYTYMAATPLLAAPLQKVCTRPLPAPLRYSARQTGAGVVLPFVQESVHTWPSVQ